MGNPPAGSVVAGAPPPGMLRENVVPGSVRGGGRLYHASPVEGYSEAEMIAAARTRLRYNRQRAALKEMLSIFDDHRTGIPGVMDKQQFDRTLKVSVLGNFQPRASRRRYRMVADAASAQPIMKAYRESSFRISS